MKPNPGRAILGGLAGTIVLTMLMYIAALRKEASIVARGRLYCLARAR
jgi:hypothetical protein